MGAGVSREFDIHKARRLLLERRQKRRASLDARYGKACADFRRIAAMIWEQYRPEAVYQWGSLLNRRDFSEISDIDIAVAGEFSAETIFEMYGKALDMTDLPLDIVELAKIHPLHAKNIRRNGRLVYGKG
jgi:predicted nucleotidyltransferase